VILKVRRANPGLIVYKLCLRSNVPIELVVLAVLMKYIVQQMNQQNKTGRFRPIDLKPQLARNRELEQLAKALGLTMVTAAVARATWSHFWKAVVTRFAVRGATAAALSAADGAFPVGELLSLGIGSFTLIEIIRLSDQLWQDAERIANQT